MTERTIEYLPIADLPEASRNAKEHDTAMIRASMRQFGFTSPAVIDERTGRLVAGHGRRTTLLTMQEAGDPAPDGITVADDGSWLMPVVRGWTSRDDQHADAVTVADNRGTERGGWDERMLAEILDELADASLLDAVGYTADDVDDMLAQVGNVEVMEPGPTAARYAETDEELAARAARVGTWGAPREDAEQRDGPAGEGSAASGAYPGAMVELVLVLTVEERGSFTELLKAIRERDGDQPAGHIVLAAMRAYAPDPD